MKIKLNRKNTIKDKDKKSLFSFKVSSDNDPISQLIYFISDGGINMMLSEKSQNQSIIFRNNMYSIWMGFGIVKHQNFTFSSSSNTNTSYDGELYMSFVQKNLDNTFERSLMCIIPIVVVDEKKPSVLSEIINDMQNTKNSEQIINLYEPTTLTSIIPDSSYFVVETNNVADIIVFDVANGGYIPISNEAHGKLVKMDNSNQNNTSLIESEEDIKNIFFMNRQKNETIRKWLDLRGESNDNKIDIRNPIFASSITLLLIIAILVISIYL